MLPKSRVGYPRDGVHPHLLPRGSLPDPVTSELQTHRSNAVPSIPGQVNRFNYPFDVLPPPTMLPIGYGAMPVQSQQGDLSRFNVPPTFFQANPPFHWGVGSYLGGYEDGSRPALHSGSPGRLIIGAANTIPCGWIGPTQHFNGSTGTRPTAVLLFF